MGQTLVNFSRVVPHGLLTFFSSYQAKDECVQYWLESGIMASLRKLKEVCQGNVVKTQKIYIIIEVYIHLVDFVFVEERGGVNNFIDEIERFSLHARKKTGSLLLGVCRGKASEGVDFADHNGRAVIITGTSHSSLLCYSILKQHTSSHRHSICQSFSRCQSHFENPIHG